MQIVNLKQVRQCYIIRGKAVFVSREGGIFLNVKMGVLHNPGKRYKKKEKNKKKIFGVICIIVILISIVSYILRNGNSPNVKTEDNAMNTVEVDNFVDESLKMDQAEETIGSDLPDKIGDYEVIGELVIEKIGLKTNILGVYDENSLDLSVTKFYGPDINHIGNFCITGHNYPNMFKRLKELNIGDEFYMINKEESTKETYKIFDMYSCSPTDLECLDPRMNNVKEVTLITCNPGALTRLICKAKAI